MMYRIRNSAPVTVSEWKPANIHDTTKATFEIHTHSALTVTDWIGVYFISCHFESDFGLEVSLVTNETSQVARNKHSHWVSACAFKM